MRIMQAIIMITCKSFIACTAKRGKEALCDT
jgi:hypothetical protein